MTNIPTINQPLSRSAGFRRQQPDLLLSPSEWKDLICRLDREMPCPPGQFLSYKEFCDRINNFMFFFPLRLRSSKKIFRPKQKRYKKASLKLEKWFKTTLNEYTIALYPDHDWLAKYHVLKNAQDAILKTLP